MSDVVFYSEPESYAREVFVPGLEGASCVSVFINCAFT
jgi:hypothetical protein